jgi:TonB-dependent receptor
MTNHRRSPLAAAVALAIAAHSGPSLAGDLTGRITDSATGRPLPSARVRLPEAGRETVTDRSGQFRMSELPAGTYKVEASYVGFEPIVAEVVVPATGAVDQAIGLKVAQSLEEVTVVGFRLAQTLSLQDKKEAANIKDSVSADDAGKLPDQNAAEALSRVAGLSVTTDQGEGRYVTIRGIDASLNNVTIDSQIVGTPEGDTRRVALDTVPANLLSKLEVIKAVTPDLDGNAVGGTINIVTPSAFDDPDGRFLSASVDYGYYDLNEENPYGGSVAWGQVFGDDRWGIVLSASYSQREFRSENLQGGDPWDFEPDEDEGGFLIPDEFVLRDYTIERIRSGVVANLEFRPDDSTKLYFRNLYNRFKDTELQPESVFDYRNGDLVDQTPTSGTFLEGEAARTVQERLEIQSIQSSTLGGEWHTGAWTLGGSLTYGESEQDTPDDVEWSFELDDAIPMTYDTSQYFFNVEAGPEAYDAGLFEFDEVIRGGQLVEEELKIGQVDLRRDLEWGASPGFIKFGAKYLDRNKTSDQDLTVYDGFDGDLLLSDVSMSGRPDFYDSERHYVFGPKVDIGAANQFFRDNEAGFEVSDADTAAESFGVDYDITEKVSAGYLMGSADVGRATIIGGVRVEHTSSDFSAYDVVFVDGDLDGDPAKVAGSKSYTNWLPGLQVRFAARDDLIMRAAWTNTLARPSYEQNVPFRIFETEEVEDDDGNPTGEFEGAIEMGNPDLDPLESMNFDVALEWYLEPVGLLSAGVFYKDIENPIFNRVQTLEGEEFEGRTYEELEIIQPQNAESGEIFGIELNYQQQFTMLPRPFDGLGVQIGYTYTDSEADVFDRDEPVPFFLQSEHVGNIALYYEKSGFELRLGYTYRSEYLDAVGDEAFQDLYVDEHGQLDLKTSYEIGEHFTVFLQVQNLNDEPLRYFSGSKKRLAENEIYSWNALAGIQFKL